MTESWLLLVIYDPVISCLMYHQLATSMELQEHFLFISLFVECDSIIRSFRTKDLFCYL
jgi:hypothetical protein